MVVVAAVKVIAAGLAARGVVAWYGEAPYQDYRSAMSELVARVHPGDAIAFSPDQTRFPATFYLRNVVDLDQLTPAFPSQPWGQVQDRRPARHALTQAVISTHARAPVPAPMDRRRLR